MLVPSESALTFQHWGHMLADFSQYRQLSNPEASLRRGLLEEVLETNFGDKELTRISDSQGQGNIPASQDKLERESEIADIWYYRRQIGSYCLVPDQDIIGEAQTIDDFQGQADINILPIQNISGERLSFVGDREIKNRLLAVTALRVVDIMNPKESNLWLGLPEGRPTLGRALMDLAKVTGFICRDEGLSLSRGMINVYRKLSTRERKPAVISEAGAGIVTSDRARLGIEPWVNDLILRSVSAHYDPAVQRPLM